MAKHLLPLSAQNELINLFFALAFPSGEYCYVSLISTVADFDPGKLPIQRCSSASE